MNLATTAHQVHYMVDSQLYSSCVHQASSLSRPLPPTPASACQRHPPADRSSSLQHLSSFAPSPHLRTSTVSMPVMLVQKHLGNRLHTWCCYFQCTCIQISCATMQPSFLPPYPIESDFFPTSSLNVLMVNVSHMRSGKPKSYLRWRCLPHWSRTAPNVANETRISSRHIWANSSRGHFFRMHRTYSLFGLFFFLSLR